MFKRKSYNLHNQNIDFDYLLSLAYSISMRHDI